MQRTLTGCGLPPMVPPRRHSDDDVICDDGFICKHGEANYDCKGGAWYSAEERHEADVQIVSDVLDDLDGWVRVYCTENSDYSSMYDHIIDELSHEWPDRIEPWLREHYGDRMGHTDFDDQMDWVVGFICNELDGSFDCEAHYQGMEYDPWYGKGCCLWSTDIGEHEEQVDINDQPELKALHDDGRLDDVLDDVNCDVHVSRSKRRVKNEETGRYENVGRDTYMPYDRDNDYPCLMTYHMPGGSWHWVVDEERMEELVVEALEGGSD